MSEKLMNEEVDEIAQCRDPEVDQIVTTNRSREGCRMTRLLSTSPRNRRSSSNVRRAGALRPMPYCLGIGSTRVGPGLHPQYTRAWYAREAVGGPSNSTSRNTAQTSVEHSADEHVTQV